MRGYNNRFLEVDLSTGTTESIELSDETLRRYIGGRGLAAKILWDRLGSRWESIDPLGPENMLLLLTGPLTGYFPGGRTCVSGKSPQTNGIVGSTLAGEFGIDLRCAGFDGIIVTGKSVNPVYLFIKDSEVEIKDAGHLWGKDGKETLRLLTAETRKDLRQKAPTKGELKEPSILYIGPAGENKVRMAAVATKWSHAAGYGGYGAVMGAKNLKAIVAKGTGPLPEVVDLKTALSLIDKISDENIRNSAVTKQWGTGCAGYDVGARVSAEPIRNWQEEWHNEKSFGVDQFEQRTWVKHAWSDFGCSIGCLKVAALMNGPYKGAITDNPDYELQAYLGPNLGIFNPEENVFLCSLIDDLGLCGIQAGNALGFAAELYQRGILDDEDFGGRDLKWGNVQSFASLLADIANKVGIGEILAEGTHRAAIKLSDIKGMDLMKYAVVEKGMALGAHGVRSGQDFPTNISYACSVQAGDHTSTAHPVLDHGNSELKVMLCDSGVYCWFNTFEVSEDLIWSLFEAVTDWKVGPEEWFRTTSRRILQIQRAALLLGGPDLTWNPSVHDNNPLRFFEPLPSGPYAKNAINRIEMEKARKEYYEDVGWDKNGIPKSRELRRLDLDDVDQKLEELRRTQSG